MVWSFALVIFTTLCSWHFLDLRIAVGVMELIKSSVTLHAATAEMPDILFPLTCMISVSSWAYYLILRHRGITSTSRQFCQIIGISLPLSYLLKSLLKLLFGRINTRIWLANPASDHFHWFHGGTNYNGFPSGHMTFFAAFSAAVWIFYPRYRSISIGLMLVLAVALVITDYHFLSDVIAGTYLGLCTTYLTVMYIGNLKPENSGIPLVP
jgi:membrane-associated phospholipid phosphatase